MKKIKNYLDDGEKREKILLFSIITGLLILIVLGCGRDPLLRTGASPH